MTGKIIITAEEKPNEEGHEQLVSIDMRMSHASRPEGIRLISALAQGMGFTEKDWAMLMLEHLTGVIPGVTDSETIAIPRTDKMIRRMEEAGL